MPPLDDLKVIDLTRVLAGPFCAMLLGDMGADVIKIEEPGAGDDARGWAPFVGDWSAYFLGVNRSKRSLALDLKQAGAPEVLRRLLADADVFIENFKPGSLDKLGFGYDADARAQPAAGALLDQRLRQDRTAPPPVRLRPDRAGRVGVHGHHRRRRRSAGADRHRDDRLPRRRSTRSAAFCSRCATAIARAAASTSTSRSSTRCCRRCRCRRASCRRPAATRAGWATTTRRSRPTKRCAPGTACVMIAAANPRLWKQLCAAVGVPHLVDDPRFRTNTDRVTQPRRAEGRARTGVRALHRRRAGARPRNKRRCPAAGSAPSPKRSQDPQVDARQMLLRLRRSRARRLQGARQPDQALGPHGACRRGVRRSSASTRARFSGSLATRDDDV